MFQDEYYTQADGVAIGWTLIPVLANIFMVKLELTIDRQVSSLSLYTHYLDDIFILTNSQEEGTYSVQLMNELHKNIRLTTYWSTQVRGEEIMF